MKTTMIKSAIWSLATVGLACNIHAQAVGFGLSFNSAGLNSIGFSYAGGNFGVGLGFNTYSPTYYPSYPYCGTYYSWPAYSTFYWGPTCGYGYPWYSWYYPAFYYSGWYGCAHPYYYGCSSYYGYHNGCYPNNSGYYYAQPHGAVAYNGAYGHAGGPGYVVANHNAALTPHPPTGVAAPISRAPMTAARPIAGSAPYNRVFSSAYWDQPQSGSRIPASQPGVIAGHSVASNPSKGVTAAPGSQRVFGLPTFAANSPARPATSFAGYQPGRPGGWTPQAGHTTYSNPTASPRSAISSQGFASAHYAPAWYRPGAISSGTTVSRGPFAPRQATGLNQNNQGFSGAPRSASGNGMPQPAYRSSGSGARAVSAPHSGFTGGQLAQAGPVGSMGGGHAFGGFRH